MVEDNLDDLIQFESGFVSDTEILDVLSEDQRWYGKWVEATQKELTEASETAGEFINEVLREMGSEYFVVSMEPGDPIYWHFESTLE